MVLAAAIPLALAAAFAGASSVQSPRAAADRLEQVLALHRSFVLGPAMRVPEADLELTGLVEGAPGRMRLRVFIRRRPFAFRGEYTPENAATPFVVVSNALRAWQLELASTSPWDPKAPISWIEYAFFEGLRHLEPGALEGNAALLYRSTLPWDDVLPVHFERNVAIDVVEIRTPAGTVWHCYFDSADGRLHGMHDPSSKHLRWIRWGDWKKVGSLTLPATRIDGTLESKTPTATRIERTFVRTELDDELFAGDPEVPPREPVLASPLRIASSWLPGSGYFVIPMAHFDGRVAATGLIDTGVSRLGVDRGVITELRLPPLTVGRSAGVFGTVPTSVHWIDRLDLRAFSLRQLPAIAAELPPFYEMPNDGRARFLLGGDRFIALAPVLDLRGEVLYLRGASATSLAKVPRAKGPHVDPAPRVLEVPIRVSRERGFGLELDVRVGKHTISALVDSGTPAVLRLSRKGLHDLGLPSDPDHWVERGALPFVFGGIGRSGGKDLVVRLERVAIGDLELERPWVMLAQLGEDRPRRELSPHDALLGTGALLALDRVGIDFQGAKLELEVPAHLRVGDGPRHRVPDPGELLGVILEGPPADARVEPDVWPQVRTVIPGTPAAEKGLERGDRLCAIDGVSTRLRSPGELHRDLWLRESRTLVLDLLRADGERVRVRVP